MCSRCYQLVILGVIQVVKYLKIMNLIQKGSKCGFSVYYSSVNLTKKKILDRISYQPITDLL